MFERLSTVKTGPSDLTPCQIVKIVRLRGKRSDNHYNLTLVRRVTPALSLAAFYVAIFLVVAVGTASALDLVAAVLQ